MTHEGGSYLKLKKLIHLLVSIIKISKGPVNVNFFIMTYLKYIDKRWVGIKFLNIVIA